MIGRMGARLFRRTVVDPDTVTIAHEGERYEVLVRRRPLAKRFTLRVSHATGEVVLTIPKRGDIMAALRFAQNHSDWIALRVKRVPRRVEFRTGTKVPYRGVPHRIVRREGGRGVATATRDEDGNPIIAVTCEPPYVARRVSDFLRKQAARDLDRAVAKHTAALGIAATKITVRDTKTRWGSCTATGRLNFSWRLIMAPPFVLDYLAAHEVAHLKEMNHSVRFWRLAHRLCPRTEEAESWLKAHGASLHRYG
jgi:predicted metal-dependent hydrolase